MENIILYDYLKDSSQWLFIPIFVMIILIFTVVAVKNYKDLLGVPIIFKIAVIIVCIGVIVGFGRMAFAQSERLILASKDTRTSIELDEKNCNYIMSDARGNPYSISFKDSNDNIVSSFNVFTKEDISTFQQHDKLIISYDIIDKDTIYIYVIKSATAK